MKPNCEGIWEWFDEDGTRRLVSVCNVGKSFGGVYLRVYWWGGYYNVNDEHDPEHPEHDHHNKAEWPDRWGNRVGDLLSIAEEHLYEMPTPEERERIMQQHKNT